MSIPAERNACGLRWNNGVGSLSGYSFQFRLNEFGMLEVIRDSGDNLKSVPDNPETFASDRTKLRDSSKLTSPPVPRKGRSATVTAGRMRHKSPEASTASQATREQPSGLQPNDANQNALTSDIVPQSVSLESISTRKQSRTKPRQPSTAPPQPPKHMHVTANGSQTLEKSVHLFTSVAPRQILELSEGAGTNGSAASTSSVACLLLPGATSYTGAQYLSAQYIYDLLSQPEVRKQAVRTIPAGPKANCFFVVNIGAELTDYKNYESIENRQKIRDKLRDRCAWLHLKTDNRDCFTVSDSGILTFARSNTHHKDLNKDKNAPFDLRLHRTTHLESEHVAGEQPLKRSVCWFFNSERAPAPGFVIVVYQRSYKSRAHKTLASNSLSINKVRGKSAFDMEEDEADESAPATKRKRRSRNDAECECKLRIAGSAGSARTRSNYNVKSRALMARLASLRNRLYTQKVSLETTRTMEAEEPEPADQLLLSLGLKRVSSVSRNSSASQMTLPLTPRRDSAFDMMFASVPDPSSVSRVHSLSSPGTDQFAPEQASFSKTPTSQVEESQSSAAESNKSQIPELDELGVRESPQRSILTDADNFLNWNADRVAELVTDVLRDVGTDEETVAAVRVGFAREAIDGVALTRLGQQELSQRFGLRCGSALRIISSMLSHLSVPVRRQSEPSPVTDTTACGETQPAIS